MQYEYLLFNLFIFSSATLGGLLYPHTRWPKLSTSILAIVSVSLPYLIWDQLVTNWWWQFNPRYVEGWQIGRLPIEEILFFIIIPWSCLVIWENLKTRIQGHTQFPIEIGVIFLGVLIGIIGLWNSWWYTLTIGILCLLIAITSLRTFHWLRQKSSLCFLSIVMILTFIFNGYLTARPVVLYNTEVKLPIQILTIPIEDFGYGLALIGLTVMMYDRLNRNQLQH